MRIIFMGTPEFAVKSLKKLIDANHEICCVISQPDRPANRGHKIKFTSVKECAAKNNIPVYQPKKIKSNELLPILERYNPEIIIVAAYGKILPEYILNFPKYGCINVHASILPKYRGAAPIQRSIINGDSKTGVTIIQMDKGMDTGDIIKISEINIKPKDTSEILFGKLAILGAETLIGVIHDIASDRINRIKQLDDNASYAPMITKEEGLINFNDTAFNIHNLIRGLNPKPAAYTFANGIKIKILISELPQETNSEDFEPGKIVKILKNTGILVGTGNGLLIIKEIIPENSKKMSADIFFSCHKDCEKLGK